MSTGIEIGPTFEWLRYWVAESLVAGASRGVRDAIHIFEQGSGGDI